MLSRYTVNKNFELDGDLFLKGSTFLHDEEEIGEMLCKSGFISPKPKYTTITIKDDPFTRVKYLSQMNLKELITVAENENIALTNTKNKKLCLAEIKAARARRGESTR